MSAAVVVEDVKPLTRNTLRGFARVRMPSGLIFHDVSIHEKDGKAWASPGSLDLLCQIEQARIDDGQLPERHDDDDDGAP
jgi:hypothetical protein